jgi:hypothetical protein
MEMIQDRVLLTTGLLVESNLPTPVKSKPELVFSPQLVGSLHSLILLCETYGFKPIGKEDFLLYPDTLNHWQLCSVECSWMKFLKYKIASFFSYHGGHAPLPKPFKADDNPAHICGGRLGRFMHKLAVSRRSDSFLQSILYSKGGMPRPGKLEVEEGVRKTFKLITTKQAEPQISLYGISKERVLLEIRRTARDVINGKKFTPIMQYSPNAPSFNANYTDARSVLGTFGTMVKKNLISDPDPEMQWNLSGLVLDMLGNTPDQDATESMFKNRPLDLSSSFTRDLSDEQYSKIGDIDDFSLSSHIFSQLNSTYRRVYTQMLLLANKEDARVILVGLAEALKIRTISKGPASTYFVLKPLQQFLWSCVEKSSCATFIGTPITSELLSNVFKNKKFFNPLAGDKILSADYSDATNNIDPDASFAALDEMCLAAGVSEELSLLGKKALTGHYVFDPDLRGKGDKSVGDQAYSRQEWGQLMGSPMSFPVLCVINLAVYRLSMELCAGHKIALKDAALSVNGDDAVLGGGEMLEEIWSTTCALIGLVPSVGKVYFHKTYLNMNSAGFRMDPVTLNCTRIKHVNMGLMMGLGRSAPMNGGPPDIYADVGNYGVQLHDLIATCPTGMERVCHEMFIRLRPLLKKIRVPWYVPKEYGGLGFPPLYNFKTDIEDLVPIYGPTEIDLKICRMLSNEFEKPKFVKLGDSTLMRVRQSWTVGNLLPRSKHIMGLLQEDPTIKSVMDSQSAAFGQVDLFMIYCHPGSCISAITPTTNLVGLRRNEHLWERLFKAQFRYNKLAPFERLVNFKTVIPARLKISEYYAQSVGTYDDFCEFRSAILANADLLDQDVFVEYGGGD